MTTCEICRHWVIPIWTKREPHCACPGRDGEPTEDCADFLDRYEPLPRRPKPGPTRYRPARKNFQARWQR